MKKLPLAEKIARRKASNLKWRLKNKEKIRENQRRYRKNNCVKVSESQKKFRLEKRESLLAIKRRYNESNKELINEKSRQYAKEYAERIKESKRKYRENNRDNLRLAGRLYYLRLKNEKEVKKMFGNRKKKEEAPVLVETPDLVVNTQPKNMGMPGFTEDVQQPVSQSPNPLALPSQEPVAPEVSVVNRAQVAQVAPAPVAPVAQEPVAPAPVEKEWYTVQAAELIGEGLYRYILTTNKVLGDIGGTYEL